MPITDDDQISDGLPDQTAPLVRIRALASSLPASDRRAAEVILRLDEEVLSHSITDVATAANVAESTVIRACKRLGFGGFQGLKLAIARDRRPRSELIADEIGDGDTMRDIMAKVFAASSRVLADAATSVNIDSLEAVADAVVAASSLLIVGVGPSSPIAQDAAYRFRSLGLRIEAPVDSLTQHLAARLLPAGGVCLAVSHTGATRETLFSVAAAREAGAVTAAVTSFARSPLTRAVDYALVVGGRQMSFRVEAMASRLGHLCVLDALYIGVAKRREQEAETALALHHQVAADHQM